MTLFTVCISNFFLRFSLRYLSFLLACEQFLVVSVVYMYSVLLLYFVQINDDDYDDDDDVYNVR